MSTRPSNSATAHGVRWVLKVFTQTDLVGEADREHTVRFLGTLRRDRQPAGTPRAGSADGKAFAQ
jgi:hypothetical protein